MDSASDSPRSDAKGDAAAAAAAAAAASDDARDARREQEALARSLNVARETHELDISGTPLEGIGVHFELLNSLTLIELQVFRK